MAAGDTANGVEARIIIEPGANKDKYFDNEQLIAQTKIANEVFDAMDRHLTPARQVVRSPPVRVSLSLDSSLECPVRLQLDASIAGRIVEKLPPVRCQALHLFDHSSGHDAGATDGRSVTSLTKGPDWHSKVPRMRDGYYLERKPGTYREELTFPEGFLGPKTCGIFVLKEGHSVQRVVQRMQFEEGDRLLCDLTVPSDIDLRTTAEAAATALPQVHQHC